MLSTSSSVILKLELKKDRTRIVWWNEKKSGKSEIESGRSKMESEDCK
jgi:hypothetical protein